jgi:hypothetical protein
VALREFLYYILLMPEQHWEAISSPDHQHIFAVALIEDDAMIVQVHHIQYTDQARAERVAASFNRRDADPADLTPDARYAREVADWRGRGCPPDETPVLMLDPSQPAPDLDPEQSFG